MSDIEDTVDGFLKSYAGLACEEVMRVIYQLDWDSIHEWKDHDYNDSLLCDMIGWLYEDHLAGHTVSNYADEIILAAHEVLSE